MKDSEARVDERVRKAVSGDPTPIDGIGYQQDAFDFIVPVIDSIYFGINESLPNVRMEITLVEGDSNNLEEDVNTCVLSQYVTISRLTKEITFPDKVVDNTPVEVISNEDSKNRKGGQSHLQFQIRSLKKFLLKVLLFCKTVLHLQERNMFLFLQISKTWITISIANTKK